jgi:rod shape determining protein RodA
MMPVLVLLVAQVIVQRRSYGRALGFRDVLPPLLLMFLPIGLIVLQPDLGTAIIILLATLSMLWFAGLRKRVYALFALVGLVSPSVLWLYVLKPYQKERVLSFLRSLWETSNKANPLGVDYHARQAIIGIGSWGFFGKGFMQGTQHMLRFIPEHHTDFIFTVFAEEWGFLGCMVLFLLFASLIWRIMDLAKRAWDELGSLIAIGLGSIIFFQFVINVLMAMHWVPVVGIPLPLVSYGGSSLVSTLVSMGILLNIGMKRYRY